MEMPNRISYFSMENRTYYPLIEPSVRRKSMEKPYKKIYFLHHPFLFMDQEVFHKKNRMPLLSQGKASFLFFLVPNLNI